MDDHSLYRDPANGRIAGVCAGLAEYFELGAGLVRILFVLLVFVTTPVLAILIYAILALMLPARPWRLDTGYRYRGWRRY
ncbi:MAG TPA: PspC domain-containing protein [Alphaproteobacteria bacterium]|nr:PspC domain-containing protein [Alphaproteobacteria bacterium]